MRLITDIFKYCTANVPKWNTISISGYHIREAGSTAVQEVAFTLANAIAYCEAHKDYVTRELFDSILTSEEEHVDWLETQLSLIERVGLQNYQQSQT